jgi:hypothetical protein
MASIVHTTIAISYNFEICAFDDGGVLRFACSSQHLPVYDLLKTMHACPLSRNISC